MCTGKSLEPRPATLDTQGELIIFRSAASLHVLCGQISEHSSPSR